MGIKTACKVYVLLDIGILSHQQPLDVARAVLAGGATMLQLRAKQHTMREQVALATALLALTRAHDVPLIINDHVDIALAVGADGAHLGVNDLPVVLARQIMPHGLIGYSPEGVTDAQRAVADGADYLGVGPFAATQTKRDAGSAIGSSGIAEIARSVPVPVVAVGGIGRHNAVDAIMAGAAGIAVGSAIVRAPDPTAAARLLNTIVSTALMDVEKG
jgi:thiamine-phosphate diphosphorylase